MEAGMKAIWAQTINGSFGPITWTVPEDLRRFRAMTMGGTVLMGRKTWESLPNAPLDGRTNIVATSREIEGAETVLKAREAPFDSWVIGGATMIDSLEPYITECYVTVVGVLGYGSRVSAPRLTERMRMTSEGELRKSESGLRYRYYHYTSED